MTPAAGQNRRLVLWPLIAWLLLAAVGYLPTKAFGGLAAIRSMLVAQVVVLGVVYATFLPALRRLEVAPQRQMFQIAIKAGVVRFLATLLAAGGIAWRGGVDPVTFLVWVAVTYLVLIKVETVALVIRIKELERRA